MTKRTTKRALLLSCLSLLLCVSMLVGTTFAWFTDSASTGVNTIQSGNLDIALYAGDQTVVDGKVTAVTYSKEVDKDTKLFNDDARWEPGYTEVAYLKVENLGSLALKYQLTVNVINEVVGTSVLGGDIKLSQYLKYDVIEISADQFYATREDAIAAIENEQNLATEVVEGTMESGDTLYLALVIYMPTTVGNEANHDGKNIPSIQLGVNLLAAQYTSEYDSFDNQYDAEAKYYPASASELLDAILNANDGEVIKLQDNIAVTEPLEMEDKEVTIDLAGNNLTLGNSEDAENVNDGLVVSAGATLNLINTSSEKTTVEYLGTNTRYDAIYVDEGSTLNIGGNVDIKASPEASSVIHATMGSIVNIAEGTNIVVKGETENQFPAIFIERNATVNMTGGSILVESNLTVEDDGWNNDAVGVVLRGANAAFNMSGGTITVRSKNAMTQGVQIATENGVGSCTVNITGGNIEVSHEGIQGGSYLFAFFDTRVGQINVSGGNITGEYDAIVMDPAIGNAASADVNLVGGTYCFDPTAYVPAEGCVITANGDNTWTVVQRYAVDGNTITVTDLAFLDEVITMAKESSEAMTVNLPAGEIDMFPLSQNWGAYKISLIGATNEDGTPATIFNIAENTSWGLDGAVKNIVFKDTDNSAILKFMDGNSLHANVVVENCVFDGASMQFTGVATVKNSVFNGNGAAWSGIQYSAPDGDILIENCQFSGYCFTNLQVTDEGAHKELTVTVRGCTIGALSENAVSYAEGVTLYVDTIVLENNTFDCDVWTPAFAEVTKTNNTTSANGEVSYKNW